MPGGVGAEPCGERERDEREPGHERARAEDVLEVDRAEEEEAEDRAGRDEHQEEPAADCAVGEPLDLEERLLGAGSRTPNAGEPDQTGEREPDRLGRGPACAGALRDRVDDRAEACRCEERAAQIHPAPTRLLGVGRDDLERGDRERDCDREVDEEDHPPVGELGEEPADEHADRRTCAADRAPGGERLRLRVPVEAGRDDRERGGGEHRRSQALPCTCCEQRSRGSRERGGDRRHGEDAEAGQEQAAASEQVGGAAAEEEEAAEDERVARDRPADLRTAELQVVREARAGRCSRP